MTRNVLLVAQKHGRIAAFVGDGTAAAFCPDVSAPVLTFTTVTRGHEELFVLSMLAPPAGSGALVLVGTADFCGFTHVANPAAPDGGAAEYPSHIWSGDENEGPNPWSHGSDPDSETTGIDYGLDPETQQQVIIRASIPAGEIRNSTWHNLPDRGGCISYSFDGGATWQRNAQWYNNATLHRINVLGIAVNGFDYKTALVLGQKTAPWRSNDGGETWTQIPSLPVLLSFGL